MINGFIRRLLRDKPRVDPFDPVLPSDLLKEGINLIMVHLVGGNPPKSRSGKNNQSDQCMSVLDITNPQHPRQDDQIAKRITKVILSHNKDKRNKRKQADRQNIPPQA
ncbi:hypothetical protein D3C78_1085480 [compost metagenome]